MKRIVHEGLVNPKNKFLPLKPSCGAKSKTVTLQPSKVTCRKCKAIINGAVDSIA